MVFFGKASDAKQYFIDLGFATVPRQTTPDFLVSVTTDQRKFGEGVDQRSVPKTASELANAFAKSELGQRNVEDVERYRSEFVSSERRDRFVSDARAEKAKHVRNKSPYVVSYFACVARCRIGADATQASRLLLQAPRPAADRRLDYVRYQGALAVIWTRADVPDLPPGTLSMFARALTASRSSTRS